MSARDSKTGELIMQGNFCGHCGLWIPKDMQVSDKNGMPYCSKDCRKKEEAR